MLRNDMLTMDRRRVWVRIMRQALSAAQRKRMVMLGVRVRVMSFSTLPTLGSNSRA